MTLPLFADLHNGGKADALPMMLGHSTMEMI
jgi:hypothetical protein